MERIGAMHTTLEMRTACLQCWIVLKLQNAEKVSASC